MYCYYIAISKTLVLLRHRSFSHKVEQIIESFHAASMLSKLCLAKIFISQ